jgi:hypothetical protein
MNRVNWNYTIRPDTHRVSATNQSEFQELDPWKAKAHNSFRVLVNEYFESPTLVKLRETPTTDVWYCNIRTLLKQQTRLILAVSPRTFTPIGTFKPLEQIQWSSIQTRTLPEYMKDVPFHEYTPKLNTRLKIPISVDMRKNEYTSYSPVDKMNNVNFSVHLLHSSEDGDGGVYQYQDTGNVITAIETYKTIINLL